MIYDRTILDVREAQRIRANKVQKNIKLSESDIETLERGMLTINTLNRIENKQKELKDLIAEKGYSIEDVYNKTWEYSGIFNVADFERIIKNLKILTEKFYLFVDTQSHTNLKNIEKNLVELETTAEFHYTTINNIEKALADLETML